jgi:hypothetical protein
LASIERPTLLKVGKMSSSIAKVQLFLPYFNESFQDIGNGKYHYENSPKTSIGRNDIAKGLSVTA